MNCKSPAQENFMTQLSAFVTLLSLLGSFQALACYVEINGQVLEPTVLKQGSATIVENNGDQLLLICGEFKGKLEGVVNRVSTLKGGDCSVVPNEPTFTLYACEKE
jgi:hypothetical protein